MAAVCETDAVVTATSDVSAVGDVPYLTTPVEGRFVVHVTVPDVFVFSMTAYPVIARVCVVVVGVVGGFG
jgi:hypothetical protein